MKLAPRIARDDYPVPIEANASTTRRASQDSAGNPKETIDRPGFARIETVAGVSGAIVKKERLRVPGFPIRTRGLQNWRSPTLHGIHRPKREPWEGTDLFPFLSNGIVDVIEINCWSNTNT